VTTLADRIRGIVAPSKSTRSDLASPGNVELSARVPACGTETLGARVENGDRGPYFVVETRISPEAVYGNLSVAAVGERLHAAAGGAPLVAAGAPARSPFLFFDVETTGLAGGAGTLVFLVGCGGFAADGAFLARQFFLSHLDEERPLLAGVRNEIERAGTLVSFNGKSFDAPILETRYLFHRLEWTGGTLPHIDVLHPARRLWADNGCSLVTLEAQVLGVTRVGDLPGIEAPARYFQYLRTGDAGPLRAVLEHNRRDLLALATLTSQVLELVQGGAGAAGDAQEALGLGAIYWRAGLDRRASEAFERALAFAAGRRTARSGDPVSLAALRALAVLSRRARRYAEAAEYWRQLLEVPGCPPHVAREATEALAIHHEHRLRDFAAARMFALRSLGTQAGKTWGDAVRHRVARIDRKLRTSALPLLFPALPSCPSSPSRPFLPSSGSPTSGRRTSS
jgi:uncharacterized protein